MISPFQRIPTGFIVLGLFSFLPQAFADDAASGALAKWSATAPHESFEVLATGLETRTLWAEAGEPLELVFRLGPDADEGPYRPLEYSRQQWYDSTFWTGPDWTRVGDRWHHPGNLTPSIRRFAAPRDGSVTVTGRVFKLHLDGDGVRAAILHNERQVWAAEIEGKDAEGVDPNLSLAVQKGDSLRFIVDKRGAISCDTTGWDPIVKYGDGETFQASKSFGTKQGAGHWFYEMEAAAAVPRAEPWLYAIDTDFVLHRFPVAELKEPFSSEDWLPLFVVTDGHDASCLPLLLGTSKSWTFSATFDDEQVLRLHVGPDTVVETVPMRGPWTAGLELLHGLQGDAHSPIPRVAWLRIKTAYQKAVARLRSAGARDFFYAPDPDLLVAVQNEWLLDDGIDGSAKAYRETVLAHLDRTAELLDRRTELKEGQIIHDPHQWLRELRGEANAAKLDSAAWARLHQQTRLLKRYVLLSDSRFDRGPLLFCKRKPPSWSHLVAQYYGWRQRPGGGIFLLNQPGYSTETFDLVKDGLPEGSYLEPSLSFDAQRLLFSFVACEEGQSHDPAEFPVNEKGQEERYYHVYELDVDTSRVRQLTSGLYDDLMPTYLPDGHIAFCSTRRRGYSRCFGPEYSDRWDVYTLHRMAPDGSNIRRLSANDVNEWFPAVSNQGELLFARWDYIDRDAVTHQNLWAMRPDGTNPIAVWGNAVPKPHCMFQAKPIPGSGKFVFIASAHHSITAGPVCVVDPAIDRNADAALQRITPGPFPEAESSSIPEYYESPWPLGEDLFLVAYSRQRLRFQGEHMRNPNPDNALGLYLIDDRGNRELIFRDPAISSTNPIPLRARPVPPRLPSALADRASPGLGEMVVANVYEGLGDVEPGTIDRLRIVQLFPKSTPLANQPRIGFAGEENGRAILGTVPVERDGSARFLVPANVPVYFQALDRDGFAYRTMRSSTHVQPGERISCVGCHEQPMTAPPAAAGFPLAMRRGPSTIDPGEFGGRPFSYVETVQPVLDRHCVRCHNGEQRDGDIDLTGAPHDGFTRSYWALGQGELDWRKVVANPDVLSDALVPRFVQRNQIQTTPPGGALGARGSRLIELLRAGHEEVRLDRQELARLATWIDMNAIFYGVYDPEARSRQFQGELVAMPDLQ